MLKKVRVILLHPVYLQLNKIVINNGQFRLHQNEASSFKSTHVFFHVRAIDLLFNVYRDYYFICTFQWILSDFFYLEYINRAAWNHNLIKQINNSINQKISTFKCYYNLKLELECLRILKIILVKFVEIKLIKGFIFK
jgi:hypothetical protein